MLNKDYKMVLLERHQRMVAERMMWLPLYNEVTEYVLVKERNKTTKGPDGAPQVDHLYSSIGVNSLLKMSAALLGALWPNASRSVQLIPPLELAESADMPEDVKRYFEWVNRVFSSYLDLPDCNLVPALDEFLTDLGAFGTSGIACFELGDDSPVPFIVKAVNAQNLYIDEGPNGFVEIVHLEEEMTIRQLVEAFGIDNVSPQAKKRFIEGMQNEKVKVLHVIEPRNPDNPYSYGPPDKDIMSLHMELDTKHVILISGYHEMPVFITRFWKSTSEKYGRSPAMNALPDIREYDAMKELHLVGWEKTVAPPITILSDSVAGNGVIDTSANGVLVIKSHGRVSSGDAVRPMYPAGDVSRLSEYLNRLEDLITQHFFIDRLLDLNNEHRMTLGEANIRNKLRGESLGPIYSRQYTEIFNRLIKRAFNILFRRGLLGVFPGSPEHEMAELNGLPVQVIPEALMLAAVRGEEFYRIKFLSPASRIMQVEELMGVTQAIELMNVAIPQMPELADVVDPDKLAKRIFYLTGAAEELLRSGELTAQIRAARAQAMQAAAQADSVRNASESARNFAQAGAAQPNE